MLNLKNLFRKMVFIKLYRICLFALSRFARSKQVEERRTKKTTSLQLIKRTRKCHPTRTSDK